MLSISFIGLTVLSGFIQAQQYGDIRLVGRRLEVYYLGEWGTVCDDQFGDNDAEVACKELGYSTGISLGNDVDDGTGIIWLDDVNCSGFESKLTDCVHPGWSEEDCGHTEDVGLYCYNINSVQGNWSSWTSWTICNASHSGDFQSRSRKCNDPFPSEYDLYCNGSSMETQKCNTTSTLGFVEKTDNEMRYSAGVVAGVAIGCIIITIAVMFLGLYAVLRLRIYKQSANQSSKPEESYDDLKINQTTGVYSVYTNQNNTQTVISKTNNRQSNVPGDTCDNLGQDFYENISQK
ncbi:Hypothetical predicted protein [Mytilus galloprovincialis]|uniref:SRCR domain-containing protein n=1 Tax=Mytilus galloprovincialis TaxID=29158 RepID=A0A8B6GB77_MYTGA|nr:Hypothetical predicted protein [Mytilus galloprovincialis]